MDRSSTNSNSTILTQEEFDSLFKNLLSHEKTVAVPAAAAVLRLTKNNPLWLERHKALLLELLHSTNGHQLKWLPKLLTRISLSDKDVYDVWDRFAYWMLNKNENKLTRLNSLQGLFDLSRGNPSLTQALSSVVDSIRHENIPSLNRRIKKLGI